MRSGSTSFTGVLLTRCLRSGFLSTIVGLTLYARCFVLFALWLLLISEQKNLTPRFEFGFGLSYTTFAYSNLQIGKFGYPQSFPEEAIWESGKTPSTNATGSSRAIWLHRPAYLVTFDVQNDGEVAGTEVGQERSASEQVY